MEKPPPRVEKCELALYYAPEHEKFQEFPGDKATRRPPGFAPPRPPTRSNAMQKTIASRRNSPAILSRRFLRMIFASSGSESLVLQQNHCNRGRPWQYSKNLNLNSRTGIFFMLQRCG